jgi:hypothetical protein
MFVRTKTAGIYQYLQIVQNERVDGRVRQQIVATLGRLDVLQAKGQLDGLVSSCARFAQKVSVLNAYQRQALPAAAIVKIGPPLALAVCGKSWVCRRSWRTCWPVGGMNSRSRERSF